MAREGGDFSPYRRAPAKWSDTHGHRLDQTTGATEVVMSSSQGSWIRTRMFARVLGPFFVIVSITAVARTSEMPALMSDFGANPLWSWVAGPFVLIGGLVMIALHSYWRSPAAVIVSISGWLVALRGLLLLAVPP